MAAQKKVKRRAGQKKGKRRPRGGGKRRVQEILGALEAMIGGLIGARQPRFHLSGAKTSWDAICYSVNILVGELEFATANLRRARAEAEAANAAKSSFLRAASHELRTPLAVIVWLAEAIKDRLRVPPERFERSLAGILRSADELLRTTEAVLDLSRLDETNEKPADGSGRRPGDHRRGHGEPAAARRSQAARDAAGRRARRARRSS